ncbi:hypothetical protein NP493_799g04008 [Ridgeia piscesae]|uniref:Uncharacterized protein n=1 Tax=Ridgeia piscesae TaxID=27915 RepID=A0AAD9KPX2_RIDPI|nr:hypothetical protein NP493_799g04008 [Ridgeia piscesae]
MSVYWVTEAIPLPATALMPLFIFPMLGVFPAKELAKNYLKDTNMLMMGGLLVAVSVEKSNLHKRIALRVLRLVGSKPKWLLLGFMLPTAFLSMWISNTATAAMMLPICQVVLDQFEQGRAEARKARNDSPRCKKALYTNGVNEVITMTETTNGKSLAEPETETESFITIEEPDDAADDARHASFSKALCLCIAYAANIGGTASLTGTGPNLVLTGIVHDMYKDEGMESPITYTSWMAFGVPGAVICVLLAWVWVQIAFIGFRRSFCQTTDDNPEASAAVSQLFQEEYEALGPLRFAEGSNLVAFLILVMLWLFRDPKFMPGWGDAFRDNYVTDASSVMLVSMFLFFWPSEMPQLSCWLEYRDGSQMPRWAPPLLDWKSVHTKMSWGVLILLGGGFALADVCEHSGLSATIGQHLLILKDLPHPFIVALVVLSVAGMTEMMSNTATSSLLLPILGELAVKLNLSPLYLMLPGCVACSFAFMLPVATPPNAIIYSGGHLKVIEMIRTGLFMHLISISVITLGVHTWGMWFFQLNKNPFHQGLSNFTIHHNGN